MSQILQDVENEKTRNFYIKRAQHVLKKLDTPLDNYAFFITHFDDVIQFLSKTKTNSGLHVYDIAISKFIQYIDTSDDVKKEYKQKYLDMANDANKLVKNKNKPIIKKTITNMINDPTQYIVEEEPVISQTVIENKPETRKSSRILEQKENTTIIKKEEEKPKFRIIKQKQLKKHNYVEEEIDEILSKMNKKPVTKRDTNINYYNLYVNTNLKINPI